MSSILRVFYLRDIGQKMSNSKKLESGGISTNSWMTTFSDLITLLLTFFVLLFSMSSMDDQKLKIAFQNFGGSSGLLFFREYREIARPLDVLIDGLHKTLGEMVIYGEQADFQNADVNARDMEKLGNFLSIQHISNGIKIVFGINLLYSPGSAEINEIAKPALDQIAKFVSVAGYQVYIDGHTDNIPISSTEYSSNEDLSIARALNVRDYLLDLQLISPDLIALTGYGEIKPVASNDTPEGKLKNRRVEIILKNQTYF
jgi:chemotaxis protein MotB